MNDTVYNYIRESIKSGKSIAELTTEISSIADEVKAEETNKPIVSQIIINSIPFDSLRKCGFVDSDGKIILRRLATMVTGQMIQNGFKPDGALEVHETIDAVEALLRDDLGICKAGVDFAKMPMPIGMSLDSLLKGLLGAAGRPLTEDFNRKH